MASDKSEKLRIWLTRNLKNAPPAASIEEARAMVEFGASRAVLPEGVQVEKVTAGTVPAEWVRAAGVDKERVVIHLHGGGYTKCSCNTARLTAANISAASGCSMLVVDYRLAPENPFPAALEDSKAAYRWLLEQGFTPDRIVLLGDSAGGGLALATMVSLLAEGVQLPCASVLLSPWTDLTISGDSITSQAEVDPWVTVGELRSCAPMYLADTPPDHPLVSPLFADLQGLPPLLIHVGTDEILRDDSVRLAEKARAAGVDVTLDVWEKMWHVWHYFELPEAAQAIEQVGLFVKARLGISG